MAKPTKSKATAKSKVTAKSKLAAKAKAATKAEMAAESDARIFAVDTRFQKMARREGGVPRDKAIEQARTQIEDVKSNFDDWLAVELKEFENLMKKVEGATASPDWIKAVNFHSRQLRDSSTTFGFELLAFISRSLCEILDSIEAGSECNMESITCHIESLFLAGQMSYRHLRPEQVPELTEGLHRVVKRVTAST
jgi:hypothetical protein